MSDVIKLLPDSVANQIAAGEVIQRPASVVKELVENAVDAGATEITVIVKDAGRTLIQVVDNGRGMSATDARMAFERHATSKITRADDLFALHTMGFRGEALASICAVAQVDMRTMRRDDSVGTRILINGSRVESQQPEACAPGTNMMVKNLFFNVPARRKFLKKDSVELSNILHEFERLALVNTTLEMTLIHNDVTLLSLPSGNLKQRIVALFGKALDSQLIPVETDTSLARISGFVVRPAHCRRRGALQYFTVNGRNMRHPYFHKAVMQCYEGLVASDAQPNYFIDFSVAPESIDVNIHPTKHEIKFEQEQAIRQILYAAVKETLGRFDAAPSIDFSDAAGTTADAAADDDDFGPDPFTVDSIPAPGLTVPSAAMPPATSAPAGGYNPFSAAAGGYRPAAPSATTDWEKLYRNFADQSRAAIDEMEASRLNLPDTDTPPSGEMMRVGHRYIAMPHPDGLRIIDIHRAHVAVLCHRLSAAGADMTLASQRLIFPGQITLTPDREPLLRDNLPQLEQAGFDLAPLGQGTWSINSVPSVADSANPADLLDSILHDLAEDRAESAGTPIASRLALALARAAAFRADRALTDSEMHHLVADLMSLPMPGFTPSGEPVFTLITPADIEKML